MSDRYTHSVPAFDITFDADRLRRERQELLGELTVRCGLPGARVVNGILSTGDFNFSSVRARQDRAKFLRDRAQTAGAVDWIGLLEDFCQRVFDAERTGDPAIRLRDLPAPERGDDIAMDGLVFPRRQPSIIFGDGGAAKSLTALHAAGKLAQRGLTIALFDWELCGDDHRDRYARLFRADMPPSLFYCRCERPLVSEVDRLRRIVREHGVDYAIFDSIAFACDGPPEAAEIAGRYFRAVREIGIGSLHVAHINKSDSGDQKPFGSAFWHNGARSTWFVKAVEQTGDDSVLQLGFYNRKSNLGPIRPPTSYAVTFASDRITFERTDITDNPELAGKLTIRQRMVSVLKRGSMSVQEIADEIDERVESVNKSIKRNHKHFIVLAVGRIGLRA